MMDPAVGTDPVVLAHVDNTGRVIAEPQVGPLGVAIGVGEAELIRGGPGRRQSSSGMYFGRVV